MEIKNERPESELIINLEVKSAPLEMFTTDWRTGEKLNTEQCQNHVSFSWLRI